MNARSRMKPVLRLESFGERCGELREVARRAALEKQSLRRRARLLIELPYIACEAPTPGLPLRASRPARAVHRRDREPRAEYRQARPGRKWQRANLRHGLGPAPDDRAIDRRCHGALQISTLVLEACQADALEQ